MKGILAHNILYTTITNIVENAYYYRFIKNDIIVHFDISNYGEISQISDFTEVFEIVKLKISKYIAIILTEFEALRSAPLFNSNFTIS